VGLGSGVISIELLSAFPHLQMWASDLKAEAIAVAERNAKAILLESASRLHALRVSGPKEVFESFPQGRVDFIISNPPYLGSSDGIEEEVLRYEPSTALFAPEEDWLHFYRKIAQEGVSFLNSGGFVFCEIPHERADQILELFRQEPWKNAELVQDLSGRPRVLVASLG